MTKFLHAFSLAGAALGAFSAPVVAQTLSDKFWLQGSAYWPDVDTHVSVVSKKNPTIGTDIDLEQDLDLADRKTVPAVYAGWRISSHFQLAGEYYSLDRNGTATLARNITFDDVTYPASASLQSGFNTNIYRLTFGYVFVRRKSFEIGGALGLHATNFDLSLTGQGSVGNAAVSSQARKKSFLAPLPTVGLFGTAQPAPRLTLGGRIDYLSLTIDQYHGRLINSQVTASYRVMKNVGIGAMYRYVDYRVDVDKPDWSGHVKYKFKGPALFLEVGF